MPLVRVCVLVREGAFLRAGAREMRFPPRLRPPPCVRERMRENERERERGRVAHTRACTAALCTCTLVTAGPRSRIREERRTSLQILSIAVCLSGRLSVRKSARARAARYGMKCLLHSHPLFMPDLLSLSLAPCSSVFLPSSFSPVERQRERARERESSAISLIPS